MTIIEVSPLAITLTVLFLGAALAFLAKWFWSVREDNAKKSHENDERIRQLENDVKSLSDKVSPFWAAVQARISKDLHHPSPQFEEMDGLLHELSLLTITDEGRERLESLLRMRAVTDDPEVSSSEKDSAKLMMVVMRKTLEESRRIESDQLTRDADKK